MVRLSVTLSESASAVQEVLTALRYLIGYTRLERGCLSCAAWADANTMVHYEEAWETEADAQRHVRTPGFTSLLAVMETAQEAPLVRFEFVTKVRGLDYVAEVRHNGDGLWS